MITSFALSALLGGEFISSVDAKITSLEFDSRHVTAGSCFFAFPGIHTSGENFIEDAVKSGAVMIVTSHRPQVIHDGVSYLIVNSPERALSAAATTP